MSDQVEDAAWRHERAKRSYDMAAEQALSWAKWLTASLLALNGAGSLAILNAAEKFENPLISGSLFIGGLFFALLSGWFLQFLYFKQASVCQNAVEFWSKVERTSEIDEDERKTLNESAAVALRMAWVPPTLGWLSGLLFFAGAVVLGCSAKQGVAPPIDHAAAQQSPNQGR